jgi:hypothetical protein
MTIELIDQQTGQLAAPLAGSAQKFQNYLGTLSASTSAQTIRSFLNGAKEVVGVLITEEVDSMYIPPSKLAADSTLARFNGGVAVLNPESTMKIKGTVIPLGVSLIHELGHAKQFLEKPQWFEATFDAAIKGGGSRATNPAKYEIEDDNVSRHEKPVCLELGKPAREKYD